MRKTTEAHQPTHYLPRMADCCRCCLINSDESVLGLHQRTMTAQRRSIDRPQKSQSKCQLLTFHFVWPAKQNTFEFFFPFTRTALRWKMLIWATWSVVSSSSCTKQLWHGIVWFGGSKPSACPCNCEAYRSARRKWGQQVATFSSANDWP